MPIDHQPQFKVMIRTYVNGPWSSIVERPVTLVSWDTKRSYWLNKLEYAQDSSTKPCLFSRTAAEHVLSQVPRFKFEGPGPGGTATAKIVPMEVK